ncbi:uncharacterized protein LOC125224625 [Leguminivora glycinivorella]|uniref:uncharacterized protein LOC125224625 n=1 Tax=Leguminivora glycinivorella TaxID=1035111 RepID=UPI00200FC4B9|nr:uncharacterized protein LOC125224625 [Leguminivora glycinivorella]
MPTSSHKRCRNGFSGTCAPGLRASQTDKALEAKGIMTWSRFKDKILVTRSTTPAADARKAGRHTSRTRRIPIPPLRTGNEAKSHCSGPKHTFKIPSVNSFTTKSKESMWPGCIQTGEVRKKYVTFGTAKQDLSKVSAT